MKPLKFLLQTEFAVNRMMPNDNIWIANTERTKASGFEGYRNQRKVGGIEVQAKMLNNLRSVQWTFSAARSVIWTPQRLTDEVLRRSLNCFETLFRLWNITRNILDIVAFQLDVAIV
jgi:hypothetical protein